MMAPIMAPIMAPMFTSESSGGPTNFVDAWKRTKRKVQQKVHDMTWLQNFGHLSSTLSSIAEQVVHTNHFKF